MSNISLSDKEIENLLCGKWRFNTDWEKFYIEFKDDMTYEQTRIQTFILSKPRELITGNKFTGVWHVDERTLCLMVKSIPKFIFNLDLPKLSKNYILNKVVSVGSSLLNEKYEIWEINNYEFFIKYNSELFIGTKIK
ncbi:hypothetical protein NIES4103_67160 [Nostoc sp. NIES-4103]|nr:hypothetical protein NIES4103_67160 [Nostoc sp. NIES-4103]